MPKENDKILVQWEVQEIQKDPNALGLTILSVVISIGIIIYSIREKEWLMGGVFLLAIFVIIWTVLTKTKPVKIAISSQGITIGKNFYDFEKTRGYWFPEGKQIFSFEQKNRIGAIISFPLGKMSAETIRGYLPDYLVEMKERGENLFNRISKKIKSETNNE